MNPSGNGFYDIYSKGGPAILDEGVLIAANPSSINFVGAGVTVTAVGNAITVTIPGGGGGSSPLTTKGDLYTYTTTDARLPVGTNGYILSADSGEATGLKWNSLADLGLLTGSGTPTQIAYFDSSSNLTSDANFLWDPSSQTLIIGAPAYSASSPAFILGTTVTGGSFDLASNCIGFGFASTDGIIKTASDGSLVFGISTNNGILNGGSSSLVFGNANNGSIRSTGESSLVFGQVTTGGIVEAPGNGALAFGNASGGGNISAVDEGSVAIGSASNGGVINAGTPGSFAIGQADGGEIRANAGGAWAVGKAGGGEFVTSSGENSVAWGNNISVLSDDSFGFGSFVEVGGNNSFVIGLGGTNVYSEGAANYFAVAYDGSPILSVNGSNGRVGIGTSTPASALDVLGLLHLGQGSGGNTKISSASGYALMLYPEGANTITLGKNQDYSGSCVNISNGAGLDDIMRWYDSSEALTMALNNTSGKISTYNKINTAGWGVPAVYGSGRLTAQTAAVASVAPYTVGATDGSFIVSANILVTTATLHNFTCTVTYTDEGNTSRTLTLNFSTIAGVLSPTIANAGGAAPYEGVPLHIRAKASTAITLATVGTFTTVIYNVEGSITQIA